jgi:phosphatidylglycerol---prolipoprotein diacylglyceryl transferase
MNNLLTSAYAINLGWLRIGPPYIYINIDPVLLHLGPLAVRWYGLMYVVGIAVGLWVIKGYTERKGINQDMVYRVLWWCIAAGLIGGRLYFVIQQPDLYQDYILKPQNILATWEGGMAFFGAIFLVIPTLFWRARVERINPLVLIDAGVLFAAAGQIFGRIGNLINGDIIGYVSPQIPWSTVYQNPNSWACLDPTTCNVPVQPAAGYELLINLILLGLLLFLARRVRRPGLLMLVYLFGYCITQFLVFFTRANVLVNVFGITVFKQAQWTALVVFVILLPITYLVLRYSKPIPAGEVAATYGIEQKSQKPPITAEPIKAEPVATIDEPEEKHEEEKAVQETPLADEETAEIQKDESPHEV